jgi:hypothetical protein
MTRTQTGGAGWRHLTTAACGRSTGENATRPATLPEQIQTTTIRVIEPARARGWGWLMPDYLAPGVYIEETGSRPQSIAGVETSTAAFVGLTASGPVSTGATALPLLTSLADFERFYGGLDDLHIGGAVTPNYVAHAVRAFFANGGRRLHVARVPGSGAATASAILDGPSLPQGAEAARIILRARTPSGATLSNRPYVNCSVHFVGTAYVTTKQAALQEPPGMLVQAAGALYVLGLDLILTTAADLEGWNALADDEPVTLLGLDVEVTEPWSVIDYVSLPFTRTTPVISDRCWPDRSSSTSVQGSTRSHYGMCYSAAPESAAST